MCRWMRELEWDWSGYVRMVETREWSYFMYVSGDVINC